MAAIVRTAKLSCLLALVGVSVAGCGDDDDPAADRTLVANFAASVGGQPVSCSTMYSGLGTNGASAELADARLFVSEVEARNGDGTWVPMALTDDGVWQSSGVALLDFEDGADACDGSGTAETNASVVGTVPAGDYDGLRFSVGVPFALNHNDNATADPPFNVPGMFWNWQGGYKFLRVDWMVPGGDVPRWNVHIGSTGCVATSSVTPPSEACGRSNRARIEVRDVDIGADTIDIDLAALVEDVDITVDSGGATGCQSRPDEPDDCTDVFSTLGLSFTTGDCVGDCAGQTIFE